jgi:hypothetical protein
MAFGKQAEEEEEEEGRPSRSILERSGRMAYRQAGRLQRQEGLTAGQKKCTRYR